MKKIIHYIAAILILIVSIGQKDIQLLIKENVDSTFILNFDDEAQKEDTENEKEKENLEEEIEGKRKKNEISVPITPFLKSGSPNFNLKILFFIINEKLAANCFTNLSSKLRILFCSLVFYH